ncbi:MAG: PH domain-containing protein [Dehalococcoidales bacterium]|nr:PH domain-containing protein [Dehalococcoidales bacterium]
MDNKERKHQIESVVYEERPSYDISYFAGPVTFVSVSLVLAFYFAVNDPFISHILFPIAFIIGGANWALIPRKLSILQDSIKIVQGGPFSFKVPFDKIIAVRIVTTKMRGGILSGFRLNWETSNSNNIEITRKGALRVTISPKNPEVFLDNLHKAMNNWRDRRGIT